MTGEPSGSTAAMTAAAAAWSSFGPSVGPRELSVASRGERHTGGEGAAVCRLDGGGL